MSSIAFDYIDNDEQARRICELKSTHKIISIDTEFDRSRTFYAKAGLIQLCIGSDVLFIDPLSVSVESYRNLLLSTTSLKLLHACGEDLELLHRLFGQMPEPIFDTQLAATFAGFRPQIGYQGLVSEMLGIDIPKHQTRSDWLQRPLSDEQLEYAALDVHHLEALYEGLVDRLQQRGRLAWVQEECATLLAHAKAETSIEEYYRHIGNAWQLRPRQLAVLRELSVWRELEVRRLDIPRSFLISDSLLWEIARELPQTKVKLSEIEGFKPGIIRKYGELVLVKIEKALSENDKNPPMRVQEPLSKAAPAVAKKLKAVLMEQAKKIDLPVEVLCRKKSLEELMLRYVASIGDDTEILLPLEFQGWRSTFIVEPLMAVLDKYRVELQRFVVGAGK